MDKIIKQKEYYRKYYEEHKEYFRIRNSAPEKKEYYKQYYQKNKFKQKKPVETIIKHTTDKIIVYFN